MSDAYGYLPNDKVVALCTGSQGEPRAALARIAQNDHPEVTLAKGDRVIFSSRTIPGNEKAVSRVVNGLIAQEVEVITDRTHLVHVSGPSARGGDGGDARLGEAAGAGPGARRGIAPARARLDRPPARHSPCRTLPQRRRGAACARRSAMVDELPSGRLYKDGAVLVSAEGKTVSQRRKLSFSGIVTVALAITEKGVLAADPEIDLAGIPEQGRGGIDLAELADDTVMDTVETLPKPHRRDPDALAESVRRAVRAAIAAHWGKKPICVVHVLTV